MGKNAMKISRVPSRFWLLAGVCCAVLAAGGMPASVAFAGEAKAESTIAKPPIDSSHPLFRPLELAYESREAMKGVKDYQGQFIKQELIGRKLQKSTMNLKLREEPFSVYLLFAEPNKGREVIFVSGKNKNQLLVHETGIKAVVGTVSLDPKGDMAMDGNKYPVTMIGMGNMLDKIISQWEGEGKYGETTVQFYPDAMMDKDTPCEVIETTHPQPRDQFKFHKTRLFLHKETRMPRRVEQYGFPGKKGEAPLVEEYTYSQLKLNVGMTDRDFDTKNPSYAYPK
jgi:hypothetical protein